MSESRVTAGSDNETRQTDRSPIGLLVESSTDPNLVAGLILRATERGHGVVIEYSCDPEHEALAFADRLGAHVVRVDETASSDHDTHEVQIDETEDTTDPIETTLGYARDHGFPGVIWVGNPTAANDKTTAAEEIRIDYAESTRTLQESSSYVVDATLRTDVTTDDNVIVGIPAYNEEVGIGSIVLKADTYADEVVVVDDGSADTTVTVAREAGATVIEHETNEGKGAAIQTLFQYVAPADFDTLVLLDGDGQHAPADIPDVIEPVIEEEADVVVGSRYLEDQQRRETPLYRRFGQRVLDMLTLGSSRVNVTDSQSGFRALSPAAVEQLTLNADSFGVESEMINEAAEKGLEIEEQPIEVRYEGIDGQTQNPLRHGLTVVAFLLQLVRDRHPLLFFGLPGLVLAFVGAWYGVDAITVYQNTGQFYPAKVLVSGFATLLGTLSIFMGLVLNRISNIVNRVVES